MLFFEFGGFDFSVWNFGEGGLRGFFLGDLGLRLQCGLALISGGSSG